MPSFTSSCTLLFLRRFIWDGKYCSTICLISLYLWICCTRADQQRLRLHLSCGCVDSYLSVPWILEKRVVSCIMSKGGSILLLIGWWYCSMLSTSLVFCIPQSGGVARGAVQRNTILFPLKAYSLWNLCKAAASVQWRCTTHQCWLNCRSTLQRNGYNFFRLDGDFIMTTHSLTPRIT